MGLSLAREHGWTAPSVEATRNTAIGGPEESRKDAAQDADATGRTESEVLVDESPADLKHEDNPAKAEDAT